MTASEMDSVFEEIGFHGSLAYNTRFRAMQALLSQGVAEYDHVEQLLKPTGKGFVMVEIIDGKEVKVVY